MKDTFNIYIDVALRKSGVLITKGKQPIEHFLIKYDKEFNVENFEAIVAHKKFIKKTFQKIKEKYKKFDKAFLEADVLGYRKGGFKNKELMTIVRMNYSFSLSEVLVKPKNIHFITASVWKRKLLGNAALKKAEYKERLVKLIEKELHIEISDIKSMDILDAYGIFLYFFKSNVV
ncbi:hypothetical protein YS40_040 [Thermus phage phiYS40]|uniref:hypothetical protein n=1 Tax=Thermus phage phiYS40 TaxID=407392 RepID=UPI0000E6899E|nr:hypothetical protein YS40_040 [Thermus phage phiYS40]ABJ91434.1 hypothetical protein YS40_040 [Thermus phage phiYS40]BAK53558.1 hypothetical protein YSP_040 [Thermus phage phiYS40]